MSKEKTFNHALFRERLSIITHDDLQTNIAAKIGVKAPTLSKWLNADATPSINDLLNISREYGCSIDYLIGNDRPVTNEKPSTRQLCEMLMTIGKATNSTFKAQDLTRYTREGMPDYFEHYKMDITIEFECDWNSDYQIGKNSDAAIILFFKKYYDLIKVEGLPAGTLETCVKAWLHEIDEKEKNPNKWLDDIDAASVSDTAEKENN